MADPTSHDSHMAQIDEEVAQIEEEGKRLDEEFKRQQEEHKKFMLEMAKLDADTIACLDCIEKGCKEEGRG